LDTKDVLIVESFFQQETLDVLAVKPPLDQKPEEKERSLVLVYIRKKKVKGENYLYLVRSVWDPKKSSSRQEIIKYLGNAEIVTQEDIPMEYRENPRITAFLSTNIGKNAKQRDEEINKLRKNVFNYLTSGERDEIFKIYETYSRATSPAEFFDKILRPVMYKIGEQWAVKKLSVAAEHIASNIAHDLVKIVGNNISKTDGRGNILVCTAPGEEHNLGCNILESFLQSKKYKVYNLSPNAPSQDVLDFITNNKLDLILVSITLEENIKPGQRLTKKIKENFEIPVYVGGLALENSKAKFEGDIIQEDTLPKIYNLVRAKLS
jgi:MerR family transcriptional regulator, light-induced transcriptional regulator